MNKLIKNCVLKSLPFFLVYLVKECPLVISDILYNKQQGLTYPREIFVIKKKSPLILKIQSNTLFLHMKLL